MTSVEQDWGNYVGGQFNSPVGGPSLQVVDPTTREQYASIADSSAEDVQSAALEAHRAFSETWRHVSGGERASLLHSLADQIERRGAELARAEVRNNGKLYREMSAQLQSIPKWYRYFAGLADKIEGSTVPLERQTVVGLTNRQAVGVVACITPWNSPLLLATFALAPALAAGNTVVVKPSEHASISTLMVAECFEAAGFPAGVFNVVTGSGSGAGAALTASPVVRTVCFTGSSDTGIQIATATARRFARAVLELGGKSAQIVFDDADLDAATAGALGGIYSASGQSCIAGSRLLVQRTVYSELLSRLESRMNTIRLGDPMDPQTEMGPLANAPQYEKTLDYFAIASDEGASLLAGGQPAPEIGSGFYVQPTAFFDVDPQMRIAQEEIFGPVLAIMPFDDEDDAVKLANGTSFGLAAGVWTTNLSRAHRLSRELDVGTVWINTYRALSPAMPFGGVKMSGMGRENGLGAMDAFLDDKAVWIETAPSSDDPFVMRL